MTMFASLVSHEPDALHMRLHRELLSAGDDDERKRIIFAVLHSPVAPESLHIDCKEIKSDPHQLNKDEMGAFAKAVSGFANGSGGVVLWGVEWKDLGHRQNPGKPHVRGVRRCRELKALFDSSGKDATDRPAVVENIVIPMSDCENPEANGIVVSYIPESESAPHRARWGNSEVMDHYFRRYSDSFRKLSHAELEDMFGVRQKPDLVPQIALFKPENSIIVTCVWDIWNFGRATATAVTLEIRALINSSKEGDKPLSIMDFDRPAHVIAELNKQVGYNLLDCYLPPDAKPIRSVDGHANVIKFQFLSPKDTEFYQTGSDSLCFNWVIGAQSMRPRRGSFIIPLSKKGGGTLFSWDIHQTVKRWWGRDGEVIDISITEPDQS